MKNTDSGDRELFPANATDAVDHMPESIPATKQPEIYEAPGTSNADIPAGHPSLVQDPSSPARPESLNQPGTIYEEKTSPAPADTGPSSPMPEPVAELTESDGEYTTAEMLVPEPPLKAENNPPLLTSLPQSLRQNIPELTISFHVFTQDPATRLVSINSRTVRQGQQVAPDLILEEITPAGVILSYKGNRFRMEVF